MDGNLSNPWIVTWHHQSYIIKLLSSNNKGKKAKNLTGTWGDASVETYTINKLFSNKCDVCCCYSECWMCLSCSCWSWGSQAAHVCWSAFFSSTWALNLWPAEAKVTAHGAHCHPHIRLACCQVIPSPSPLTLPPHPCSLLNTHKTLVLHLRDCFLLFWFPETASQCVAEAAFFWVICVFLHTSHKQWQGALYAHKACIQLHRPQGVWTLCVCFLGKGGSYKVIAVFYGFVMQWSNNGN